MKLMDNVRRVGLPGRASVTALAARVVEGIGDGFSTVGEVLDKVAEQISPAEPTSKTLFDPDALEDSGGVMAYPLEVQLLYNHTDWEGFHDSEVCAFADVADMELAYTGRGQMIGPLLFEKNGHERVDASERVVGLPGWVEEDGLRLLSCEAEQIVVISETGVFDMLSRTRALDPRRFLLVTGHGLPRAAARRLLRRLSQQFDLPVYVLEDNDCWGYFAVSLLKRGCLDPADTCPYLAVDSVRHIGLSAGEGSPSNWRPWQPRFDLRLQHLMGYECFAAPSWQAELQRFEQQQHAAKLADYIEELGAQRFVQEYLVPKLDDGKWLD